MITANVKSTARLLALKLIDSVCFNRVSTILMYHSIRDCRHPFFTISIRDFERQIKMLKETGSVFITLDDVHKHFAKGKALSERSVCITFDDCYKDNLYNALPVLEFHNVPATIFVASNLILKASPYKGVPVCNKSELNTIANHPLIEIGSHTHNHLDLSCVNYRKAEAEIFRGKKILEDMVGREVVHFSYPKGRFTKETVEIVKNAGFDTAVTVNQIDIQSSKDQWHLGRVSVDQGLPNSMFSLTTRQSIGLYTKIRNTIWR